MATDTKQVDIKIKKTTTTEKESEIAIFALFDFLLKKPERPEQKGDHEEKKE